MAPSPSAAAPTNRSDGRLGVGPGAVLAMVGAVAVRPWLWWTALRQLGRIVPPRWWARRPHLPVPSAAYLRFRLETQYGLPAGAATGGPAAARDLVTFLEWCRRSDR